MSELWEGPTKRPAEESLPAGKAGFCLDFSLIRFFSSKEKK